MERAPPQAVISSRIFEGTSWRAFLHPHQKRNKEVSNVSRATRSDNAFTDRIASFVRVEPSLKTREERKRPV